MTIRTGFEIACANVVEAVEDGAPGSELGGELVSENGARTATTAVGSPGAVDETAEDPVTPAAELSVAERAAMATIMTIVRTSSARRTQKRAPRRTRADPTARCAWEASGGLPSTL
jgi:hypothetical protein